MGGLTRVTVNLFTVKVRACNRSAKRFYWAILFILFHRRYTVCLEGLVFQEVVVGS
jgi:hypothetical protein